VTLMDAAETSKKDILVTFSICKQDALRAESDGGSRTHSSIDRRGRVSIVGMDVVLSDSKTYTHSLLSYLVFYLL
jgi:hypothetical protein